MKKLIALLLAMVMCFAILAACGTPDEPAPPPVDEPTEQPTPPETPPDDYIPETPPGRKEELGLDENRRFLEPVEITVAMWDRRNDFASDVTYNAYTEWIREQMLELHNVIVTEFIPIFRWEEVQEMTILLAENEAPIVSYTFNFPTVDEFGRQGAIYDLAPLLEGSGDIFPYLWDFLGYAFLYNNQDQETGHIWAINGRGALQQRYISFIREDWLAALDLPLPSTLAEFEAALYAFRDNAELLLGADAAQMTPLHMTDDVGWVLGPLVESFIPDAITDRENYITAVGGDARRFFAPGVKEAIRVVNRWFNDGLIHPDFAIADSEEMNDRISAGFVGAIAGHSWDQPYRGGDDGWTGQMHQNVGPEANFIAVNTFENDAGVHRKLLGIPFDRTLFVPLNPLGNQTTQEQAVAALLYWDFLSRPETIHFLQTGFEGINHIVHPNGAIEMIMAEPGSWEVFNNPPMQYDLTMPINGLQLITPEITLLSRALGYPGVESRLIEIAYEVQGTGIRTTWPTRTPTVSAEDGLGDTIRERGNAAWARAIVASPEDFDAVYDAELGALLNDFAQAAMDERAMLWERIWGNLDMIPIN